MFYISQPYFIADFVSTTSFQGKDILVVKPEALTLLCEQAMNDVAHLLRPAHLQVHRSHTLFP